MNLRLRLYHQREMLRRKLQRSLWGYCGVLLYHRVSEPGYDPQKLCVSQENFHDQLSDLKKFGTFLHPDEFFSLLLTGRKFPRNSYVITFDDGYADNYLQALPVLSTLGLTAVFYVATAHINTRNLFWWDEVDLAFRTAGQQPGSMDIIRSNSSGKDPEEYYRSLILACKTASSLHKRERLLVPLRQIRLSENEKDKYRCMNNGELTALAASPHAVIGAHTVNHLSMGHVSPECQSEEISRSVEFLREFTGRPVRHFAYPYGEFEHFNETVAGALRTAGVDTAAANLYAYCLPSSSPIAFPRVIVRNETAKELRLRLKELLA